MSQIKRKISGGTYKSVDAFRDDWLQMFDNARIFNEEGSWVYEDANVLQRELGVLWERVIVRILRLIHVTCHILKPKIETMLLIIVNGSFGCCISS